MGDSADLGKGAAGPLPVMLPADWTAAADLSDLFAPAFLRQRGLFPLHVRDGRLHVAMADPADSDAIDLIGFATGQPVEPVPAGAAEIAAALDRLYGGAPSVMDRIVGALSDGDEGGDEVDRLKDLASEAPVVRLVNHLIEEAVRHRASDIHLEPFPGRLDLRLRIDGMLHDMPPPPAQLARAVISRIKILAQMNIAERRLPQDGRVNLEIDGRRHDLRVSTMPTVHGESVVIRLLDPGAAVRGLDALGLLPDDRDRLRQLVDLPHGLILVTGPTGSGKTTTLYAALGLIDAGARKVMTAEDPVEYQIPRVNQVQVKPQIGLTFAHVLRGFMRQDPDVLLVGETRDRETAEVVVHAALTGHLVLSTLHTNDAAGAVVRLVDLGVERFLLASTLRAVVGQRLVRVLCPHCKQAVPADPLEHQILMDAGLAGHETPVLCAPAGCERCGGTGYTGRVAIVELLVLDDAMRLLITAGADAAAIQAAARQRGVRTMAQDGLRKVLAGVTTLAEVNRVTDLVV